MRSLTRCLQPYRYKIFVCFVFVVPQRIVENILRRIHVISDDCVAEGGKDLGLHVRPRLSDRQIPLLPGFLLQPFLSPNRKRARFDRLTDQ